MSADSEDDEGGVWQARSTWTCHACTFAENVVFCDDACTICGTPAELEASVPLVWSCRACLFDNPLVLDDEQTSRVCSNCGIRATPQPSARPASAQEPQLTAWGVPSQRAPWRCAACPFQNDAAVVECSACGDPRPNEADEREAALRCVACTPVRACPRHAHLRTRPLSNEARQEAREMQRLTAWLEWEARGLVPLRRRDDNDDLPASARLCVDGKTRRRTLHRAEELDPPEAAPLSADQFRRAYGAAPPDQQSELESNIRLDTDWEMGREPRRRVQLLSAAGWVRVTDRSGGHHKFRRQLPHGLPSQVVTFACTPSSVRAWDNDKAKLSRMDADARGLLVRARGGIVPWRDALG